ncbi:MAG: hypothetical protein H3Z53_09090 [archaeon]|nr:hypothetical protein [archaeon]MCP8314508.1 hypothetical protein [archaeon]MCP8319911.1 hypothetical protein [archaeon]
MVDMKRDKIRRCFRLILEKRYSDARNLLKPSDTYQGFDINPGIKFAIEGIIDFLNDKSKEEYLKDVDHLKKLRQYFKSRLSFIRSDDFDREYFETWIDFIKFLLKQLKSKGDVNSVIDNPCKEPKSYEAT